MRAVSSTYDLREDADTKVPDHAIVICGGGPTGLMLAGELALAGADVAIVERRPDQKLAGSRAGGLHARSIELLDQRGIADRFLAAGETMQVTGFALTRLDISDFPTRHNYGLALWQNHIERLLAEWVAELGVSTYRARDVVGFVEDETGVDIALSDGSSLRTSYLVGCDGGRSLIRKTAGIDFPGWDPTISNLIAEVELEEEPDWGIRRDEIGLHGLSRMDDGKTVRVMITEQRAGRAGDPDSAT
jgi:3-(3-hydroxy-phenyl)propionate hydroxylase